jgi:hypothetical protein
MPVDIQQRPDRESSEPSALRWRRAPCVADNPARQSDEMTQPLVVKERQSPLHFRAEIHYGRVIFSGRTSRSNSSPVRCPSFNAASRRLLCSTCAVWAICAALS